MKWAITGLVTISLLLVALWSGTRWLFAQPIDTSGGQHFMVAAGATEREIIRSLSVLGYASMTQLRVASWLTRDAGHFRSGEYEVNPGMDIAGLLALLRTGGNVEHAITFIEGTRFADWRQQLAADPRLDHRLAALTDAAIMTELGAPGVAPEGRFFPDTYRFQRGTSDLELLQRAYDRMRGVLALAWTGRDAGLPLADADEALVLASIVEKESGYQGDRPLIARVFVNRLARGMKLQSDPTVIYGIAEFDGNLRRVHLREAHPHNTYVHNGLPPTPIAMPGRDAIASTLHPAPGDYLYFVARGDGTSEFSVTLDEHNAAVRAYQRRRAENYRSAPP